MSRAKLCWAFALAAVSVAGLAFPAYADLLNINPATALSCGGAETLFPSHGTDPGTCNNGGFFSRFMCLFETTLGLVIATFFCHLSQAWLEPFGALLLIFMVGMGIMFVTGILEFSVKEISIALFKVGLIATFAFNTDIALNIAFAFFLNVTQNTVEIFGQVFTGGAGSMADADNAFGGSTAAAATGAGGCQNSGVAGFAASVGLAFLFIIFIFFIPFILGMIVMALMSALMFFGRAAFGYLYSLVMLTFLIASMPIFLGLALFDVTRDAFQAWLAQLFSNCIQIIIVFAFLAFAHEVDFGNFINQIGTLLVNKKMTLSLGPISWFFGDVNLGTYCTICEPNIVAHHQYPSLKEIAAVPNQCKSPMRALEWSEIPQQGDFLYFLLVHGAALYMLTSTMGEFMKMVPEIAQTLGGHDSSMTIGGVPRNYSGGSDGHTLSAPGLTAASVALERGMENAWRNKQTTATDGSLAKSLLARSAPGRVYGMLKEGLTSAKYGESRLTRTEYKTMQRMGAMAMARAEKEEAASMAEVSKHKKELERLEKEKPLKEAQLAHLTEKLKEQQAYYNAYEKDLFAAQEKMDLARKNLEEARQRGASKKELEKLEFTLIKADGHFQAQRDAATASQAELNRIMHMHKSMDLSLKINTTEIGKTASKLSQAEQDFKEKENNRKATFASWKDPMRARSELALEQDNYGRQDFEDYKSARGMWDELWNPNKERERFMGRRRDGTQATWFQMLKFDE